jgi:hypothetical protein
VSSSRVQRRELMTSGPLKALPESFNTLSRPKEVKKTKRSSHRYRLAWSRLRGADKTSAVRLQDDTQSCKTIERTNTASHSRATNTKYHKQHPSLLPKRPCPPETNKNKWRNARNCWIRNQNAPLSSARNTWAALERNNTHRETQER